MLRIVMGSFGIVLIPFGIAALFLAGTHGPKRNSRRRIVERPASMSVVQ